jgi:hypothetical protein
LHDRGDDIAQALDTVRDRVQFTWRRTPRGGPRSAALPATVPPSGGDGSGTEYLRRAARIAKPAPPPAWRTLRAKLAPLVSGERYQPATAALPESLYHLVARDALTRYTTLAAALRDDDDALSLTGPWPPFAFAPEML